MFKEMLTIPFLSNFCKGEGLYYFDCVLFFTNEGIFDLIVNKGTKFGQVFKREIGIGLIDEIIGVGG
jgi:hypothetical protein